MPLCHQYHLSTFKFSTDFSFIRPVPTLRPKSIQHLSPELVCIDLRGAVSNTNSQRLPAEQEAASSILARRTITPDLGGLIDPALTV